MPRTYKSKHVHTSPENSGEKMLESANIPKDEENIMSQLMPIWERSQDKSKIYTGQWTDEQFEQSVAEFFKYCNASKFKPTRPALQLWLGVSRAQYYDWKTKPEKYGVKSDILGRAEIGMELYLQANLDKYPTGSIFLLKTSHGLVETTNVNVTNNNPTSKEEVEDLVSKLGLSD